MITDTINWIHLSSLNLRIRFDTTADNHVNEFIFGKASVFADSQSIDRIAGHFFTYNKEKLKVRYLGATPLLLMDNIQSSSDSCLIYRISDELKGKPIFEVYYADTNLVYKRFIATSGEFKILVSYSRDTIATPGLITSAFCFYLKPDIMIKYRYKIE